jgi:uncharacterized membrane-anchored protein
MSKITIDDEYIRMLEFVICEHLGDRAKGITTRKLNELRRSWLEKMIQDRFDKWQKEQDEIAEGKRK